MLALTENAIRAVDRFIQTSGNGATGLRIQVSGGGCSGYQYGLLLESASAAGDAVVECGHVKVFIDAQSLPLLEGAIIDFVNSLDGSGFKFINPNAKSGCSCGHSFSA